MWSSSGRNCRSGVVGVLTIAVLSCAHAAEPALGERTYRHLAAIHELLEAGRYEEAARRLDALRPTVEHSRYESAVVRQTDAYVYAARGQNRLAISSLLQALSEAAFMATIRADCSQAPFSTTAW